MKTKERVISIQSLLKTILKKWRRILILCLLAALAAGGFRFVREWPRTQLKSTGNSSGDDYSNDYELIEKSLNSKNQYLKDSLLAQIDPTQEGRATAALKVSTPALEAESADGSSGSSSQSVSLFFDDESSVRATGNSSPGTSTSSDDESGGVAIPLTSAEKGALGILKGYKDFITSGIDWSGLSDSYQVPAACISETVSSAYDFYSTPALKVSVKAKDEDTAKEILDYVLKAAEDDRESVSGQYGEHTLSVENESVTTVVDPDMFTWLNARVVEMNNLMNNQDTFKTAVAALTPTSASGVSALSKSAVMKHAVKYAAIGFAGIFILYVILAMIILTVSKKILSARDFNRQYEIPKLAALPPEGMERKKGFDRIVASWNASYYSGSRGDVCYRVADANIRQRFGKEGMLLIVGDLEDAALESIAEGLKNANPGGSVRYRYAEKLNENPDALAALSESDGVIIAAKAEQSTYGRTDEILNTVQEYKKQMIGSIVLE